MATECPQCGIISPPDTQRCECGYDLVTRPPVSGSTLTVTALLFSMRGRISRSTYWLKFFLPYVGILIVLLFADGALGTLDDKEGIGLLSGIFLVLALYPSIAVNVKRCHDRDWSAWFLLLSVVPLANLWVLVELGFLPGTTGPNRFGLPERS